MDWRCSKANGMPALQMWSSEFKLQSHQKKKKKGYKKYKVNREDN
jgi:hypothetical protein